MTKLTAVSLHLIGNIATVNSKQAKSGNTYFEVTIEHLIEEGQYPKKTTYKAFVYGAKDTPNTCPFGVGDLLDITAKNITTKNEKLGDKYETFIDLGFKAKIDLIEKGSSSEEELQSNAQDDMPF